MKTYEIVAGGFVVLGGVIIVVAWLFRSGLGEFLSFNVGLFGIGVTALAWLILMLGDMNRETPG